MYNKERFLYDYQFRRYDNIFKEFCKAHNKRTDIPFQFVVSAFDDPSVFDTFINYFLMKFEITLLANKEGKVLKIY